MGAEYLQIYTKNDFGHLDKLPFEELHNKMCKRILNVGKYSSNLAARAELGRYPLIICIAAQAVKFLSQVASSPGKLSHQAYLEEKNNRGDWIMFCEAVLRHCNISITDLSNNTRKLSVAARNSLEDKYRDHFFHCLSSTTGKKGRDGNKLRTYNLVKRAYHCEPYLLSSLPPVSISAIAKIRIGSNDLEIDRGRKARPTPIPADQRYCRHCKDAVEDEVHFITICPLYKDLRAELLCKCKYNAQSGGQGRHMFVKLMTSSDVPTNMYIGRYIDKCLQRRKQVLYS